LGWGARRPDWMRDKERVAAYKASIKEQLTRAGLIRGQPRANFMQAASSSPAVAGPGPSSSLSLHRRSPLAETRFQRPYPSSRSRQHSGIATMSGSASARTSPTHLHYNNASHGAAAFAMGDHFTQWTPSYPHTHTMSPTIPVPSNEEYTPFFSSPADPSASVPVGAQATPLPPAAHEISDETYVMYYFESVRKEQFVFAGNSLTNTLYSVRTFPSDRRASGRS